MNCTCDENKLKKFMKNVKLSSYLNGRGKDGKRLLGADGSRWRDTSGFFGQAPGQCDECYQMYIDSQKELGSP